MISKAMARACALSALPFLSALAFMWLAGRSDVGLAAEKIKAAAALDFGRFSGTWYEIASIPQYFTKDCVASTATYQTLPDGSLEVINRCRKLSFTGEPSEIRGKVRIPDPTSPGELEIQFFWPLWFDQWVLEVGPAYDYAVISAGDGTDSLWIFSRTKTLPSATYEAILKKATAWGFDVKALKQTRHP